MRGLPGRPRSSGIPVAVAVAGRLCVVPAAHAAFGLTPTVTTGPNAGANGDVQIDIDVKRFAAKFSDGAVKPGKGLSARTKLTFRLKVRDAKGKTTRLRVRGK
jgi:hypothetical protein